MRAIKSLLLGILPIVVFYLAISFTSLHFDFKLWAEGERAVVAIFGSILFIALSLLGYTEIWKNK